jgi:hypothetical protein
MATEKVSTPTATPDGGHYTSEQTVTLACVTSPGVSIYYTTNGDTPDSGDTLYTVPLSISAATTLKAIGIKAGAVDSDILTAVFTFGSTIREQIMAKVGTALAGILTAGGYETNLGQKVYPWLDAELADTEVPSCAYRETVVPRRKATNLWENVMALEVKVYASSPENVRKQIADVIKAIGAQQPSWGGLSHSTQMTGEDTGIEHKNKKVFRATLNFEILFHTAYWTAY